MKLENTDIHKIIDDAMEKKDRCVSIFISHIGTMVDVQPIDTHKPHWIPRCAPTDNPNLRGLRIGYACSECGHEISYHRTPEPYCGCCGEKLALLSEDENGRD